MKPFVYVAGPLSAHPMHGTHEALTLCTKMIETDVIVPFSPHSTVLWDMVVPADYEQWLEYDLDVIDHMHAIFRMPGKSPGADKEVAYAKELGIPVYTDYAELVEWATRWVDLNG